MREEGGRRRDGMAVGTRRGVVETTNTIWQVPVSVVGVERAV